MILFFWGQALVENEALLKSSNRTSQLAGRKHRGELIKPRRLCSRAELTGKRPIRNGCGSAPRRSIMRLYIAILAVILDGTGCYAQSRPDTVHLTCRQATTLVQSHGSIVLGTGPTLYDRYVVSCNYCFDDEYLLPSWVQTADNPQCFVGYHCNSQTSLPEPSCGHTGYRGP
jgi:hypothetical protein